MFAQSYIEGLLHCEPTWQTCVDMHTVAPSQELERLMGGLASALRSGSGITHEDWGDDWIELSLKHLAGMEPLRDLSKARRYGDLDSWLGQNEDRIVHMIHSAYAQQIRTRAEPSAGGKAALPRASA